MTELGIELDDTSVELEIEPNGEAISYNDLLNKPSIEGVKLQGNKTADDLGLAKKDNVYTIDEANELLDEKQDVIDDLDTIRSKSNSALQPKANISQLTNDAGYITESYHDATKQDLINDLEDIREGAEKGSSAVQPETLNSYSLITETGNIIDLTIDSTTYVLKAILKDKNGNLLSTSSEIDLPLETLVLNVEYDSTKKAIIITLKDGTKKEVPVGDLISGLVSEDTFNTEMAKKVDKVEGSSLMTEAEHTKLEGLENYDDTDIKERVSTIEGKESTWDSKQDAISDLETIRSGASSGATAVQDSNYVHTDNNFDDSSKAQISTNKEDIEDLQDDKVDKVDGKGLSTNDFTDTYKSNIEANNIKVSNVQADWNATEGEAVILNKPTDLGKVDDVKVDGTSVVTNKVANIDLSGKQTKLISGTNIKTINNTSLLGSGNIDVSASDPSYFVVVDGELNMSYEEEE